MTTITRAAVLSRLVRAGLLTAISDGLFSSVLSVAFYHSTVTRLFQGVASTLLGQAAFEGGARTMAVGLLMHAGVAFGWSAVFLALVLWLPALRRVLGTRGGRLWVAAAYGPAIWMVMSLVVIPLLTHRPTPVTIRWWVQFFGQIPFVAVPIVTSIAREERAGEAVVAVA